MSERELDQLLDAALPGYLAEPPAGLPERVLSRVRRPRIWPWAAGLAAAAALAIAAFVPHQPMVELPSIAVAHAAAAPGIHFTPVRVRAPHAARVRPAPLTKTERALIRFAQSNPELMRQVFVEAPMRMALDLTIKPLVIEPLDSGGE